jgi:hypothetical protein
MRRAVAGDDRGDDLRGALRGREPHGAGAAARELGGRALGLRHPREDRPGVGQKGLPGGGESDAAARALDERDPDLLLEAAHRLAHRRLDHAEARRRARERALLGHRDERAELPELHHTV